MIALTVFQYREALTVLGVVGVGAVGAVIARRDRTRCPAPGCPLNRRHDGRCLQ